MNKITILCSIVAFALGGAIIFFITSKNSLSKEIEISKLQSEISNQLDTINSQNDTIKFYKDAYNYANDELSYITDSLKTYNSLDYKAEIDSLRSELFVSNYKLGRIKEYCNIVAKNASQLKYLRGWINRVLED